MKLTTKKLLTWLYIPEGNEPFFMTADDITWLLPELSAAGTRSLMHHLLKSGWIHREFRFEQMVYRISQQGMTALEQEFPAFSSRWQYWQGEWSCLTFLTSPKSDQQFRYLRSVLLTYGIHPLTRGVYLYPGELPPSVKETLTKLYATNVAVFGFSKWMMGDERAIAIDLFDLDSLHSIYSGISKEIDRLLIEINSQKRLVIQNKQAIKDIFERIIATLHQDTGLVKKYFPEVKDAPMLLSNLKKLFSSQVKNSR